MSVLPSIVKKRKASEPWREYYVFFNLNSEFNDKFAKLKSKNVEKAREDAWERYGRDTVGSISSNAEYSQNKIKLYNLTEI